jgi:tetratricopeptide (TPR) repeat protein
VLEDDQEIGAGTKIGDVILERELGTGAYGVVWRGRDTLLDRPVAVKVLRAPGIFTSAKDRKRFLAEAKVVASLASPYVVTLFHVHALADDQWALELEFVDGGTLEDLLVGGARLPAETVVRIARELATGLAAAHAREIVHGDVKPENVLLARDGSAKLADFGLARLVGERELERSTGTGGTVGTPFYMAPEVILGEGSTPASDVWSLGVVLYRMLTGRMPFAGATMYALFVAIQNEVPAPVGADVLPRLAALVERCLHKRPGERPSDADLKELLEHAFDAVPAPSPEKARAAAPAARPSSRLIGRAREFAVFESTLAQVAEGKGASVLVTGEAGAGKTAFLAEGATVARSKGFRWIQTAISGTEGLLRPLFDSARRSLEEEWGTEWTVRIDVENFGPAAPLLKDLLSGASHSEVESRSRVVWALHQLLEGLSRKGPVALVVEGGQYAEHSEWAVLRDMARRVRESPILFAVSTRTVGGGGLSSSGPVVPLVDVEGIVRIDLLPLPDETLYSLIESTLDLRLAPEVAERVVRRSEGNPLFALELLRHLEAEGIVLRRGKHLEAGPAWTTVGLPARLVDLLSGRVRKLPQTTRNLLDVAAVDGREFDGQAIAAVLGRDLLSVLRHLQKLSRDEAIVVPQARGYRFAHALLRDVVYQEVAPELRRALHRRLAEHLVTRSGEVDPERIGVHWEAAGEPGKAAPHLRKAATNAALRAENARFVDLARRSGLVPGEVSVAEAREEWERLLMLARSVDNLGGRDKDVEAIYDVLLRVAEEDRDPLRKMRVIVRRAHARYFGRGWTPSDEEDLRRAASLLPLSPDLGRARYLLGVVEKFRGNLQEATRWLTLADEAFRAGPGAGPRADQSRSSVMDQMASVALRAGRLDEAQSRYADAARMSESAGNIVNACASEVNGVLAALARGVIDGHEETLDRAIRRLRLEQVPWLAAHAMVVAAQIQTAKGDFQRAFGILTDASAVLSASTHLPAIAAVETEKGYLLAARGDLDEADRALDRALAAAEKHSDSTAQALVWAYRAQATCFRGDFTKAEAMVARAWELVRTVSRSPAGAEILLALLETWVYGLDRGVLVRTLGEGGAAEVPSPQLSAVSAWTSALRAPPRSPGESVSLRSTSALLRGDGMGVRRATLRVVGEWLAAIATIQEGATAQGVVLAAAACRGAGRLGHGPLRSASERVLEAWCPDASERRSLLAARSEAG